MEARKAAGTFHLAFTLDMAELAQSLECHATLENPLGSTAWVQKRALHLLSQPQWFSARLHQCRLGLKGPRGGLHLKPTMIKTTCAALADKLSLECNGKHTHELVQGSATSASQEYPQRMASVLADVVLEDSRRCGALRLSSSPQAAPPAANFKAFFANALGFSLGTARQQMPDKPPCSKPCQLCCKLHHQRSFCQDAMIGAHLSANLGMTGAEGGPSSSRALMLELVQEHVAQGGHLGTLHEAEQGMGHVQHDESPPEFDRS